jgi:hypothetical protein
MKVEKLYPCAKRVRFFLRFRFNDNNDVDDDDVERKIKHSTKRVKRMEKNPRGCNDGSKVLLYLKLMEIFMRP